MLKYLHSAKHNVCLVSLDFPGLSSRSHQVKELLEKNPSIKKVAIETFAVSNEVFIYDSGILLQIQNCWKNLNANQDQYNEKLITQ